LQDPNYQVTSDIPPDSPLHQAPQQPSRRREGIAGGIAAALLAAWAYGKWVLLALLKFPAMATLLSGLVAVGAYALLFPWQVAVGFVLMILVHEMGHVLEIRRQGLRATAPIFVPLLGAAIFMREHPATPIKQAHIAIAGPIAGTLAAIVALILYGSTHNSIFLVLAYLGFWINLLNMIPFGMLDGGWVLAPVSKWIQVAGLALLGVLFLAHVVNVIVILIVLIGMPMVFRRFRDSAYDAYLTSGPLAERLTIGAAWLGLVLILGYGLFLTEGLLGTLVR
jgi:Zn-dependent protease